MPLTLAEENAGVRAEREITFDFSGSDQPYRVGCTVQDAYTLYNEADTDTAVTALYPFTGTIDDLPDFAFSVSVDGAQVRTEILPGAYAGGFEGAWTGDGTDGTTLNLDPPGEFAEYERLLGNGAYMERALADAPVLDQTAAVYDFTGSTAPEGYGAATQSISFIIDPDATKIMTFGFEGGEFGDDGFRRYSFFIPRGTRPESKRLIVLGADIASYTLQGYQTGACEKGNELEGVTSVVSRTEMPIDQLMTEIALEIAANYFDGKMNEQQMEMTLRGAKELLLDYGILSDGPVMRYDDGRLGELFTEAYVQERVFYARFPLTIPAGGSVQVEASLRRGGSYDYACIKGDADIKGYDLATHLGSTLSITGQEASIAHTEGIELVRENFGFDLDSQITTVSLGDEKQYYMEVRPAAKDADE